MAWSEEMAAQYDAWAKRAGVLPWPLRAADTSVTAPAKGKKKKQANPE